MQRMWRKNNLVSLLASWPVIRFNAQTHKWFGRLTIPRTIPSPSTSFTRLRAMLSLSKQSKVEGRANAQTKIGITLIELLIVTALLSVVSLAMYAVFSNGMKIWQRVNQELPEENLDIFFDKFALDLRNSLKFSGLGFSGEEDRLEFATLVNSWKLKNRTVGKVIYSYDPQKEIINREQRDFSEVYNAEESTPQQLLKNVKSLKFKYYLYDGQKKEYFWEDRWLKEGMPLAVRIELELNNGTKPHKFTKTVNIPQSS